MLCEDEDYDIRELPIDWLDNDDLCYDIILEYHLAHGKRSIQKKTQRIRIVPGLFRERMVSRILPETF